jgi:hypothetical protein
MRPTCVVYCFIAGYTVLSETTSSNTIFHGSTIAHFVTCTQPPLHRYPPFMFSKGGKRRPKALKQLAQSELGLTIQEGQHSSVDDARAALYLYQKHAGAMWWGLISACVWHLLYVRLVLALMTHCWGSCGSSDPASTAVQHGLNWRVQQYGVTCPVQDCLCCGSLLSSCTYAQCVCPGQPFYTSNVTSCPKSSTKDADSCMCASLHCLQLSGSVP